MGMTVGSFDHSHAHEMWLLARAQHEDAAELFLLLDLQSAHRRSS
jgi:hypothetical protein